MNVPQKLGLVLTGGGARVAYQVGYQDALDKKQEIVDFINRREQVVESLPQ